MKKKVIQSKIQSPLRGTMNLPQYLYCIVIIIIIFFNLRFLVRITTLTFNEM